MATVTKEDALVVGVGEEGEAWVERREWEGKTEVKWEKAVKKEEPVVMEELKEDSAEVEEQTETEEEWVEEAATEVQNTKVRMGYSSARPQLALRAQTYTIL